MIRVIANYFQLNLTFKESKLPLDWGYLQEDGSSSGILKLIIDGDVDIGKSSIGKTLQNHFFPDGQQSL